MRAGADLRVGCGKTVKLDITGKEREGGRGREGDGGREREGEVESKVEEGAEEEQDK